MCIFARAGFTGALVEPSHGVDEHGRPDVEHEDDLQHPGASDSLLQEAGLEVGGESLRARDQLLCCG